MQITPSTAGKASKKVQQFLDEINDISEHYQYGLEARLNHTPQAITATITIVEVPPKKMSKEGVEKELNKQIKKGEFKTKRKGKNG